MKNPGIYIFTSPSGKQYVGRDVNLPNRAKIHFSGKNFECPYIHRAIEKYGVDAFDVKIIRYPGISDEALNAVERWKIRQLQTVAPKGYNLTEGGDSGKRSEETRHKMSEAQHKRIADGTHPFLGGEIQHRRVADGTHHLLGGGIQQHNAHKRLEEGTHNFLGKNNPVHKRLEEGTHNFLGENNPNHKRLEEGTHNFLGENNPSHKRVKDGTHNLLGENNPMKRLAKEGKHHFLGENNPMKRLAKEGRHPRTLKRLKGEWCYIIALSRFWYEIHDYTLKRRAEFLSKDIPDTSNAEQTHLF